VTFLGSVRSTLAPDIGIDLGTANTVVYDRARGAIVSEPSVVAYDAADAIVALGDAAKRLDGRAPGRIRVVRPLRGGTISDFKGAHTLIRALIERAHAGRSWLAPRVIACVPGCATDIECKAVEEAVRAAGPRSTFFIPQGVAAAVGAGLEITEPKAQMVVDIGGGTTEIAVLALTGVVALESIKVGGDHLDAAIMNRLRTERFVIGPLTAERLKIERGYAGRVPGRGPLRVSGSDLAAAAPRMRDVPEELVGEAMVEGVARIARAILSVLEDLPPDLSADLLDSGVYLTGGGALITGLAAELGQLTNVPTVVAPEPLLCVAKGAGEILASPTLLERLRPSADRFTRWYQSLRIGMRESYSR
jgi:rod shape-determining protein MreB and related proteins